MSLDRDFMIEFHLNGPMHRAPTGGYALGDVCLMRMSQIMCLFPAHQQIRTVEHGWTLDVHVDSWDKVEKAFRRQFLGQKVVALDNSAIRPDPPEGEE